jgi:hypothetical protein
LTGRQLYLSGTKLRTIAVQNDVTGLRMVCNPSNRLPRRD